MGIIVLIILLMMCTYQVRFTEAAVVTRFDRILADRGTEPGLHWKWPFIERVHKFDARLRTFESEFRQQSTRDQRSIVMTVFATWRIDDPSKFLEAVGPAADAGAVKIGDRLENAVNVVLKDYPLSALVNTDPQKTKLVEIEARILEGIQGQAETDYGISVNSVGIKRLNLPQIVTQAVFERMKKDREKTIKALEAEGRSEAQKITAEAEQQANKILVRAGTYARSIEALGEAEASRLYAVFEKNRELSDFLKMSETLLRILRNGQTTIVLDTNDMVPFNLMKKGDGDRISAAGRMDDTATAGPDSTDDDN